MTHGIHEKGKGVRLLLSIFLAFLATHAIVILVALFTHATAVPTLLSTTATETAEGIRGQGIFVLLGIFLHAYSMGAGTYTGIGRGQSNPYRRMAH